MSKRKEIVRESNLTAIVRDSDPELVKRWDKDNVLREHDVYQAARMHAVNMAYTLHRDTRPFLTREEGDRPTAQDEWEALKPLAEDIYAWTTDTKKEQASE